MAIGGDGSSVLLDFGLYFGCSYYYCWVDFIWLNRMVVYLFRIYHFTNSLHYSRWKLRLPRHSFHRCPEVPDSFHRCPEVRTLRKCFGPNFTFPNCLHSRLDINHNRPYSANLSDRFEERVNESISQVLH